MTNLEFYSAVGAIFGISYENYIIVGKWKKRWGPRTPGNGRFVGRGIVRVFSSNVIQVALHTPELYGQFDSMGAALKAIEEAEMRRRVVFYAELGTAGSDGEPKAQQSEG